MAALTSCAPVEGQPLGLSASVRAIAASILGGTGACSRRACSRAFDILLDLEDGAVSLAWLS
jgi:hypothetical protein